MAIEASIRDYLAQNLNLVESGLRLEEKEFYLPNPVGSKGYIDILARDRLGMLVVIEIKRSDKTAREAIHEFYKYVSLLRSNHGLKSYEIRCILISTDWHELSVPFSEFARTVKYRVDGYILTVDKDNRPIKAELFQLLPDSGGKSLSRSHMIYLFYDKPKREAFFPNLDRALKEAKVQDYCVIELNHAGRGAIVYPYALYLAFDNLNDVQKAVISEYLGIDIEEEEYEISKLAFEEHMLYKINQNVRASWDDLEIGYPEKFVTILDSWHINDIYRRGRLTSKVVIPDGALIDEIKGFSGSNSVQYHAITRPSFSNRWISTIKNSEYALLGNDYWRSGILWYFDKIAQERPESSIAIALYNPNNIISSLYMLIKRSDPAYLPALEIVVEDGDHTQVLTGFIEWDGKTFPQDPAKIIKQVFGDISRFSQLWAVGQVWEYDSEVLALHGLSYTLVIHESQPNEQEAVFRLMRLFDTWSLERTEEDKSGNFLDYTRENFLYLLQLRNIVDSFAKFFGEDN